MTPPDSGEREVQDYLEHVASQVSLPLSLAQRILAALDGLVTFEEHDVIAAELRDRMPK